jgi:hypothetical protein
MLPTYKTSQHVELGVKRDTTLIVFSRFCPFDLLGERQAITSSLDEEKVRRSYKSPLSPDRKGSNAITLLRAVGLTGSVSNTGWRGKPLKRLLPGKGDGRTSAYMVG